MGRVAPVSSQSSFWFCVPHAIQRCWVDVLFIRSLDSEAAWWDGKGHSLLNQSDLSFKQWLCHLPAAAAAKSLQSCPTLCDPTDGSPPGSAIPGILQARTLEWVAISFSSAWKWKGSRSVCPTLATGSQMFGTGDANLAWEGCREGSSVLLWLSVQTPKRSSWIHCLTLPLFVLHPWASQLTLQDSAASFTL